MYIQNDVYKAARITINLDTDEILLDRDVSGTLITESEEEESAESESNGAPTAGSNEQPTDDQSTESE